MATKTIEKGAVLRTSGQGGICFLAMLWRSNLQRMKISSNLRANMSHPNSRFRNK